MNEPIAIVSMGCVYPEALSPQDLWKLCLSDQSVIKDLSNERWNMDHHYSPDPTVPDKTYSRLAAEISDEVFQNLKQKYDLPETACRLETYLHTCLVQIRDSFAEVSSNRVGMVLGLMNPDEEFNHGLAQKRNPQIFSILNELAQSSFQKTAVSNVEKVCQQLKVDKWERSDRFLSSEVLQKVVDRFDVDGLSFIVDAACASSLASVDIGISLLRKKHLDAVIVGGAESNLSPGMYAVFSQVRALATNHSLPFDSKTEGLVQGEGAGLFVIKRLQDALAQKDEVLAVVEGCDGSSDGKTSSLFQPNVEGQKLSYSRVHRNLSSPLAHVEAHGTGTQVGDQTESKSLVQSFEGQSLPVSSIKSLIGHTKGAAGAAGLIKTLFMMSEKKIPGSSYISSPLENTKGVFFPVKEIDLDSSDSEKLFGVSGFGFGGTNYHLAVKKSTSAEQTPLPLADDEAVETYIVGHAELSFADFDPHWFMSPQSPYRLPPQSIEKIDRAQLMAVQATHMALKDAGLSIDTLPLQEIVTISASILGLDLCSDLAGRLQVSALKARIAEKPLGLTDDDVAQVTPLLEQAKESFQSCSEDHAPGLLNNVIAGRVCQAYNLKGRSYNIEAGMSSKNYGLFLADLELQLSRAPFVFLIYINEDHSPDHPQSPIRRNTIGCSILTNKQNCRDYFLAPKAAIKTKVLNDV